jgi:hypothetical protein
MCLPTTKRWTTSVSGCLSTLPSRHRPSPLPHRKASRSVCHNDLGASASIFLYCLLAPPYIPSKAPRCMFVANPTSSHHTTASNVRVPRSSLYIPNVPESESCPLSTTCQSLSLNHVLSQQHASRARASPAMCRSQAIQERIGPTHRCVCPSHTPMRQIGRAHV